MKKIFILLSFLLIPSLAFAWPFGWNSAQPLTLSANNVGINSTNPGYTLDVQGTINATAFYLNGSVFSGGGGSISPGTINQEAVYTGTSTISSGIITDNGTNVGIGTTNPGQVLDVNGNIRSTKGTVSTVAITDPINDYNAAGIVTTTTGSISSSSATTTLTVGSAAGWAVGEGIDIAGAGTSGADLITSVSAISGTTFTVANAASTTVSGATINHDDTAAINAAIASGKQVHIRQGLYNFTSPFNVANSVNFYCDGSINLQWSPPVGSSGSASFSQVGAVFIDRSTTSDVFNITSGGVQIHDCAVQTATGVTPTTGFLFNINQSSKSINNIKLYNFDSYGTAGGIEINSPSNGIDYSSFDHMYILTQGIASTSYPAILINNKSGHGDLIFNNIYAQPLNAGGYGIVENQADVTHFTDLKMNGFGYQVYISPSSSNTVGQQIFTGISLEGYAGNTNPDVYITNGSGTATQISFTGGEFGYNTSAANCYQVVSGTDIDFIGVQLHGCSSGNGSVYSVAAGTTTISSLDNYNGIDLRGNSTTNRIISESTLGTSSGGGYIEVGSNTGSVVANNELLGTYGLCGARTSSANYLSCASKIIASGTGTWSNTSIPSNIQFQTTPSSSLTQTTAMTLDQNQNMEVVGNVSIGGITPVTNLDIGTTGTGGKMELIGNSGTSYLYTLDTTSGPYLKIANGNTGLNTIYMDSNGNVGIGTTNLGTDQGLLVANSVSANTVGVSVKNTSSSGYSGLNIRDSSNVLAGSLTYSNSGAGTNAGDLFIGNRESSGNFDIVSGSAATRLVTVTNGGNVGIGTTLGDSLLGLKGSNGSASVGPVVCIGKSTLGQDCVGKCTSISTDTCNCTCL